ncbi:MAG: hypothetical protein B6I31_02830 [Desulfobacteraceae bacterium 4572_19]|nr:MAG: hypothetical protein B6I31_02830 [Desulfobacteraceae bacterium 4572_19]
MYKTCLSKWKVISNFRKILLDLLTKIEAGIDFPDEAGDIIDYKVTAEIINNDIILPLKNLVLHYDNAHFLRDGIKLAIIGAPNVGKSSLMNQLIEQERSIVTSIPGTTRDFVEDCLNLNGVPFVITDTAGIHDSSDPVEIIGIQKTLEKIEEANIILLVKDISTPHKLENSVLKKSIIDNCKEKKIITVYNKIDIINPSDNGKSKNNKSSNSRTKDGNTKDSEIGIKLNYLTKDKYAVAISALSGQGILNLKKKIVSICLGDNGLDNLKDAQSSILPNLRHKILIEQAISAADTAYQGFNCELSLELIAIDISESLQLLNDVSGISSQPDILDSIFKNFCIGK